MFIDLFICHNSSVHNCIHIQEYKYLFVLYVTSYAAFFSSQMEDRSNGILDGFLGALRDSQRLVLGDWL